MSEFMLWLSGVDRNVLSFCERERGKFVAMGGTVLTTSVLATFAATFTIHEFLHAPLIVAIVLGLGWGLAIMNLDRWLLISIRRQSSPLKTLGMALPRLALAVLIGLVIAHPLVLQAFDKEVEAQATIDKHDAYADARADLRTQYAAIPELKEHRRNLRGEIEGVAGGTALLEAPEYQQAEEELRRLDRRAGNARHATLCELDGNCGSAEEGPGPIYQAKKSVSDQLTAQAEAQRAELAQIRSRLLAEEKSKAVGAREADRGELANVTIKLQKLEGEYKGALAEQKVDFEEPAGLLDRVEALNNLTSEHSAMLWAQILIFLFILAVDTMPALAKVLMSMGKPSPYETIQEELEASEVDGVKQQTTAYAKVNKIDAELIVDEAETRKRFAKEAQDELVKKAVDAMREAGELFVKLWRKAVLKAVPAQVERELERTGMTEGASGADDNGGAESSSNGNNQGSNGPRGLHPTDLGQPRADRPPGKSGDGRDPDPGIAG